MLENSCSLGGSPPLRIFTCRWFGCRDGTRPSLEVHVKQFTCDSLGYWRVRGEGLVADRIWQEERLLNAYRSGMADGGRRPVVRLLADEIIYIVCTLHTLKPLKPSDRCKGLIGPLHIPAAHVNTPSTRARPALIRRTPAAWF